MKSIIITAPIQNVGKTTLAMLLTFCAVKRKKRVLSIDADIGRYTFTNRVGSGERLEEGLIDAIEVETLGYKFDFGLCNMNGAVELDKKYDIVIVDFDVSRSVAHGDFYLPNADLIILPQPPWTAKKVKNWTVDFMAGVRSRVKGKMMTYPVAFDYDKDTDSIRAIKWTNPQLYDIWKKKRLQIVVKGNSKGS